MNYVAVCLKAAKLLREMEWDLDDYGPYCQHCGVYGDNGDTLSHTQSCKLWAMIRELEATEGTADKAQRLEQEALHATGTCPACGFWNHPAATAYDGILGLVYCNSCGNTWQQEHDGSSPLG